MSSQVRGPRGCPEAALAAGAWRAGDRFSYGYAMTGWARTADGWAVNLDGTDAARQFSLPRLELHAGARGWTCVCHLPDGTSRPVYTGSPPTLAAAKRAAVEEALRALGGTYDRELRALL